MIIALAFQLIQLATADLVAWNRMGNSLNRHKFQRRSIEVPHFCRNKKSHKANFDSFEFMKNKTRSRFQQWQRKRAFICSHYIA